MRASVGTPVLAVDDGHVIRTHTQPDNTGGIFVVIRHAYGMNSRSMHLSRIAVSQGQYVRRGQVVGFTGKSAVGMDVVGAHLHFDLKLVEEYLPLYVRAFGTPTTGFGTVRRVEGNGAFADFVGVGVPAEPLIPATYSARVKARAKEFGIPVREV